MKQYYARQTENGWLVIEGSPHGIGRDSFGYMGKEYVFTDSGAMGEWLGARDVEVDMLRNSEQQK